MVFEEAMRKYDAKIHGQPWSSAPTVLQLYDDPNAETLQFCCRPLVGLEAPCMPEYAALLRSRSFGTPVLTVRLGQPASPSDQR